MEKDTIIPEPPDVENLEWRSLDRSHLDAVVDLAQTCFQADGGLRFLFEPDLISERQFPDGPGSGLVARLPDGRLAACIAVHLEGGTGTQRAKIVGQVRPDWRGHGIGTYLMRWSAAQGQRLLANTGAKDGVMQVATESLTEAAHQLYTAFGFECVFDELVMQRDLTAPLPDLPLAAETIFSEWRPELGGQFFQAYQAAFRERPGFPGYSASEWIGQVTENDHKPKWSLLATVGTEPAGFVIGDLDLTADPPDGYINQVGVVPAYRRRGICSALLVETMRRMQMDGARVATLAVHTNNPGAIRAYSQLDFRVSGHRARYERLAS